MNIRLEWKLAWDTGKHGDVPAYKLCCPDVPSDVLRKLNENKVLRELGDMLGTWLGHREVIVGTLRTSSPLLKVGMSCPQTLSRKSPDWAELKEKDFFELVDKISCLAELEGMANRRRILNAPQLPRWNEWQRAIIIEKKLRLESEQGNKRNRNR